MKDLAQLPHHGPISYDCNAWIREGDVAVHKCMRFRHQRVTDWTAGKHVCKCGFKWEVEYHESAKPDEVQGTRGLSEEDRR